MLKISGYGTKLFSCQVCLTMCGTITAESGQRLRQISEAFSLALLECDKKDFRKVRTRAMAMDNFHYRLISDLGKSRRCKRNSRKEPFKSSKIPKFGREIL